MGSDTLSDIRKLSLNKERSEKSIHIQYKKIFFINKERSEKSLQSNRFHNLSKFCMNSFKFK